MSHLYVFNKKVNESGLIQVIMMMGLVMVTLMGLMASSLQSRKQQIAVETKLSSDILQQNIAMYLQDNEAWKKTINDSQNTSFACLRDGSDCPKSAQPIKILRNSNNEIVVDTAVDKGIKPDGTICSGYRSSYSSPSQEGDVNGACQIHVGLTWTPLCKGVCTNPRFIQVNVTVDRAVNAAGAARFLASNLTTVTRKPNFMPLATHVSSGDEHTCAIAEGSVYCWGLNNVGQLGVDPSTTPFSRSPVKVPGIINATDIVASIGAACVIEGGQVKCWGSNYNGRIGQSGGDSYTPVLVREHFSNSPLTGVTKLAMGPYSGCAVANGAAYCWGGNTMAELGQPCGSAASIGWALCFGNDPLNVTYDGYPDGDGRRAFLVPGLGAGVTDIASGDLRNCAVVNGGLKCWGANDYRGGYRNVCGSGTWLLGYNAFNDTGTGPSARGHRVCYPWVLEGKVFPIPSTTWNISSAPGTFGDLFRGNVAPNISWDPPRCTNGSPTAVIDRGTICNPIPQTPAKDGAGNSPDHPDLAAGAGVLEIRMGGMSNCAVVADQTLRCWGHNDGKLASDIPPGSGDWDRAGNFPRPIQNHPPGLKVEMLGSFAHGYCILAAGSLYCWGGWNTPDNPIGVPGKAGQKVYGPKLLSNLPPNITYFRGGMGWNHNCAIANNRVWCWGGNANGQLGDGTTISRNNGNAVMVINWP